MVIWRADSRAVRQRLVVQVVLSLVLTCVLIVVIHVAGIPSSPIESVGVVACGTLLAVSTSSSWRILDRLARRTHRSALVRRGSAALLASYLVQSTTDQLVLMFAVAVLGFLAAGLVDPRAGSPDESLPER
ncbi:hypothetical protein [Brachybacterium phenoliresistens]|uniref:Uncharacterized protein n=1 Tax=Brachybacterium phenoliresistens TaxID=396014 RepID=Z9JN79_9MICO|nr:hypothetical protein [Brachybacterium phenoliresistens]EWS79880.1 hypothetical protein BF93_09185 [Brachybacterium phenoliresistens]